MSCPWILLLSLGLLLTGARSCCEMELNPMSLSCCNCNLSSVPENVPEEVKMLDLSFNPLERIDKERFSRLSQLQVLDLTRCGISSVEDNALAELGALHTLILTGNPIKSWSPAAFTGLNSLKKLVVVETSLRSLSELRVGNLSSLRELNAAKNLISRLRVPPYLFKLRTLDLRANRITTIMKEGLDSLRDAKTSNLSLILSQNKVGFIEPGAFRSTALRLLHLKGCFANATIMKAALNALSGLRVQKLVIGQYRTYYARVHFAKDLFEGLCGMDVKEFEINEIYFSETYTFFDCMENVTALHFIHTNLEGFSYTPFTSKMEKFELKHSAISVLPSFLFSNLKHLKELRVTDNPRLTTLNSLCALSALEVLDLSRNKIMMVACCSTRIPGMSLKHLNLSYNSYVGIRSMFLEMPHLLTLDLKHTKLDSVGQFPVFLTLNELVYLDLSYTSCHYAIHCSFCGLSSLAELRLSHTTFAPDVLGSVFQNLSSLRVLEMASCNLEHIPDETFVSLKQLQVLDLSRNKLVELTAPSLASLYALRRLDVSSNSFQGLSNDTVQILSNMVSVDLSKNPYDCSCTQEQFLLWVHEQSVRGLYLGDPMECKTPERFLGSLLRDVDLNCSWTLIYVSVLVIVVILFLALLAYNFYLKYCFLFLCVWCKDYRQSVTETTEGPYDAFVIHSSSDESWVRQELVPEMEGGSPSFQLCVHYRDFDAGKLILENIFYNGICCSRNALIIVSPHFIESKWCSFELKLAMFWRFLENRCGIILVLLKPVTDDQLRHMYVLKKHLSRDTYLKWEEGNKQVFWERLRKALKRGQKFTAPSLDQRYVELCHRQNTQNRERVQL